MSVYDDAIQGLSIETLKAVRKFDPLLGKALTQYLPGR
jgi:DNA-directed RNA polymerase specialized sigma subunit